MKATQCTNQESATQKQQSKPGQRQQTTNDNKTQTLHTPGAGGFQERLRKRLPGVWKVICGCVWGGPFLVGLHPIA